MGAAATIRAFRRAPQIRTTGFSTILFAKVIALKLMLLRRMPGQDGKPGCG
jgi:hypothetical protein